MFLDSGKCFGFCDVFLDSGKCLRFWEVFCPYEPLYHSVKTFGPTELFFSAALFCLVCCTNWCYPLSLADKILKCRLSNESY